ncbi:MAG: ParB/RepB/Spo0J family partition protein [Bacteroidales bacterium]|nr:ParB/RepB/Spo0J family partition protein [Bacteroidales bacterium]
MQNNTVKKSALGKGLGALISDADQIGKPIQRQQSNTNEIEITKIEVNPYQPRTRFDDEALSELAASIKELGLIQPITIREVQPDRYQIISGERRFRASKLAGLTHIPAYIRKVNDDDMLTMALVENVQREDLDAIEIAISYQRLIEECNITQDKLGDKVGKKRSTVTNYLRLLKLPPEIQFGIINKDITMGHARALINIEDTETRVKLYTQIIEDDLSVRKTEEIAKSIKEGTDNVVDTNKEIKVKQLLPEEYLHLQNKISERLKSTIKLKRSNDGKGEIVISFKSDDELERIMGIFDRIDI